MADNVWFRLLAAEHLLISEGISLDSKSLDKAKAEANVQTLAKKLRVINSVTKLNNIIIFGNQFQCTFHSIQGLFPTWFQPDKKGGATPPNVLADLNNDVKLNDDVIGTVAELSESIALAIKQAQSAAQINTEEIQASVIAFGRKELTSKQNDFFVHATTPLQ